MIKKPDLSCMSVDELVTLMLGCSLSDDQSDKEFAQWCAHEIKLRKPSPRPQLPPSKE